MIVFVGEDEGVSTCPTAPIRLSSHGDSVPAYDDQETAERNPH
jgi:hypothetical protein